MSMSKKFVPQRKLAIVQTCEERRIPTVEGIADADSLDALLEDLHPTTMEGKSECEENIETILGAFSKFKL